jgi:hypothetical protein
MGEAYSILHGIFGVIFLVRHFNDRKKFNINNFYISRILFYPAGFILRCT